MAGLQEQLLDMGFELERAQLAAQSARNISEAIDLMETYQDRPLADLQAAVAASAKTAAVADPEEAGTAMTGTTAADPAVSSVMCEQCTAAAASAPSRLSGPSGGAVEPGPVTVRRPTSDAEAAGWADPSKAPESAYLKLQLVSATAQAALPPLDQATAVTCLASALQPHESSTGTTVSPELLKLDPETQTFWLRVPHADADGVVWALSSWAGTGSGDEDTGDAGVAFRVIERGCHLNPQVTALADAVRPATPLTAEEKAAKLAELRQRMEAKRALKSQQQKAEDRRNEVGRAAPTAQLLRHPSAPMATTPTNVG
ncbi:hypothetical protein KEM52_000481 [Ascosphaera acerosa]|nr:hypothetical protein KEM52_000481 [Ascosphaera acerosa]